MIRDLEQLARLVSHSIRDAERRGQLKLEGGLLINNVDGSDAWEVQGAFVGVDRLVHFTIIVGGTA